MSVTTREAKQLHRLTLSKPLLELFFEWVGQQLQRQGYTPTEVAPVVATDFLPG
jgi:hypothetical protein